MKLRKGTDFLRKLLKRNTIDKVGYGFGRVCYFIMLIIFLFDKITSECYIYHIEAMKNDDTKCCVATTDS